MSEQPRPLTQEELRTMVAEEMRVIAQYWATLEGNKNTQRRIEGALHSVLSLLGTGHPIGCSFEIVAQPTEEQVKASLEHSQNWAEPGMALGAGFSSWWSRYCHRAAAGAEVVLREALVWDCPGCGFKNIGGPVPAELSAEEEAHVRETIDLEPGVSTQGMFLTSPKFVTCGECDAEFNVSGVRMVGDLSDG